MKNEMKINWFFLITLTSLHLFTASYVQGNNLDILKNRILEEDESSESSDTTSLNDFKEIVTARMSYVPSLLSLNEQEKLSTVLQNIAEKKSNNQFSDVQVKILRQMIERKRRDDDINDELVLVLSVTGLQDSKILNVQESLKEEFSSGVVKEIRKISDYEPFFTNVTDFKVIQTPKAFSRQSAEIEPFHAPSVVVMETTSDVSNGTSAGDIAAIVGVCVLTVGLVTLIAIASVFLRRSKSDKENCHVDSSNSTIETIKHRFEKESTKDRLRNKSGSGIRNNSSVKKHPWKNDSSNASNEILFVHPNDDPDMIGANLSRVLDDDSQTGAERIYRGEFIAPPGKLGVAVDTLDGVPVVHRVKPGSPLQGIMYPMDKIICIDEINTSSMTAGEVTKLMVARMTRPRRITYLRGGNRNYSARPDNDFERANSFDTSSGSI